ncbi:MAG: porin family protein [Vicinamibacterales bacterium]
MGTRVSMFAFMLFVCTAPAIQAQPVTTAVKVGIDFSSLPNAGEVIDQIVMQPSTETSSKTGILFGGVVTVPFWNRLALQPELQFVMKGAKLNEAGSNGTITASIKYLEFPVLLRYTVPVGEHTGYVLFGPTFGVKAATSAQLDGPSQTDIDIDPAIRSFDGGLAFAGGVDYLRYFVELRYTQGLNDIAADTFPHPDSVKNRNIAISVGYRFK